MNIKVKEFNETIRNQILKVHEAGESWYEIGLDIGVNDCTVRKYAKGLPVSKKIMNRLEEWSKKNG